MCRLRTQALASKNYLIIILIFIGTTLCASPFDINFPAKENLSNEDYLQVQAQLRTLDIERYLLDLYPNNSYGEISRFFPRLTRGVKQTLIDPEKGFYPYQQLDKIGEGGDVCFVCCVPFDRIYPALALSISQALQEQKFNGYFLYQVEVSLIHPVKRYNIQPCPIPLKFL